MENQIGQLASLETLASNLCMPNFGRAPPAANVGMAQSPFALTLPANHLNIFSDIVRIYGHNCFHQRNMEKARAVLYAHVHDDNHDNVETNVRSVVCDALEFSRTVAREKPDTAIEVLYIAAHLCQKNEIDSPFLLTTLIRQHLDVFNTQMDYFRSRGWMMCIEERLWVRRYSMARFFTFLNVILPEIGGGTMDNLYPYIVKDDDETAIIPFLSNFALTTRHLQALDYFLSQAKLTFEFKTPSDSGASGARTPIPADGFAWPAQRVVLRGGARPFPLSLEEDDGDFDDFYTYTHVPGPARAIPRDIEYRWRITLPPQGEDQVSSAVVFPPPPEMEPSCTRFVAPFRRLSRVGRRFTIGCLRFVDYPVKTALTYTTALGLACQASHPAAVKILLQHGATPFFNSQQSRGNYLLQALEEPFGIVTRILNRGRSWRSSSIDTISHETLSKLILWEEEEERRVLKIIQLLLRSVPYVPIKFFADKDEMSAGFVTDGAHKDRRTGLMTFQLHERFRDVVPLELIGGAASLEHLSRCAIRQVLRNTWNLRTGIRHLPLPQLLKGYINLEY